MPKVKFDKQQIKQLLKERVELVAVGVAGFLMVVFLGIGLAGLFGSSSKDGQIAEDNKKLRQAIDNAAPPEADSTPKADDTPPGPEDGKEPPKDEPKEAAKKPPENVYAALDRFAAPSLFPTFNWYDSAASGDTKRREPKVLPLDFVTKKLKLSQIDVVLRSVRGYTLSGRGGKKIEVIKLPGATLDQAMPTEDVRGTRLVLVHALFPFKEQLEQFRKALRLETVDDLLRTGQMPTVARLSVWRATVRPDGKVLPFYPVYDVFPKDDKRLADLREKGKKDQPKLEALPRNGGDKEVWVISEPVQKLLREAVYDETNLHSYGHALAWTGSTPLPRLGYGKYPKLDLDGIKAREDTVVSVEGEMMGGAVGPEVPGGGAGVKVPGGSKGPDWVRPTGQHFPVDLKKYGGLFAERVGGKVNYFSPYGVYLEPPKDTAKAQYPTTMPYPGMQKSSFYPGRMSYPMGMGAKDMGMGVAPPPGGDMGGENPNVEGGIPERLVVRFVDAGVEPGHSYQYYVTVWLENPNLGKHKEVAYPKLAEVKEIASPGAYTPWVTVPDDYRFYVVNETKPEMKKGLDPVPSLYEDLWKFHARVPVQVHQWTREALPQAPAGPIADWVIAERLLFARGEEIQRAEVELEAPAWNKDLGDFEMGYRLSAEKKGSTRTAYKKTLPIRFGMDEGGPVIVDFAGTLRPGEGNLEVLVLTRDGRLMVRNSRDDSDPEAFTGKDRQERLEAWKARLREVRAAAQAATTTDPMSPMDPMDPVRPMGR
ncbi:MAG: hypothetical protein L0Z62_00655 [Gemmataceae bacterium]|nr:hypothetical protein [Gemmataceae bacterium]